MSFSNILYSERINMLLDKINKPNDIKSLSVSELNVLASEIRRFLIDHIAITGGHLASNLGVVELTIALHRVMNFPDDKLIWDVGHQSYTHKLLTGRKDFDNLRQYGGLAGFPKRNESACDVFDSGHSSSSISAALGFVSARTLSGGKEKIACVIGDGALTGGMAYEAINNASEQNKNLVIILNDNEMSINENVGGTSNALAKMRTSAGYNSLKNDVKGKLTRINGNKLIDRVSRAKNSIKQLVIDGGGMFFEDMDVMYMGPFDGHDIKTMTEKLEIAFEYQGPVVVHVITKKGKGFEPAEKHPARFHGTDPFVIENGIPVNSKNPGYTDVFSTVMRKMGDRNDKVVAVTAAMSDGTGLKRFRNMFPKRFFDVGIAEQHAVTFCAGLALNGYIPVFAVYSSFLQRAYDQVLEDVCLQNQHVIFAIDRAGIVGKDGETHQGIFDIAMLRCMPNMTVMSPKNKWELSDMMKYAVAAEGPIAIRYPRGEAYCGLEEYRAEVVTGKCEEMYTVGEGSKKVLLFALGSMVKVAEKAAEVLGTEYTVTVTNARFVEPIDTEYILKASDEFDCIVSLEEGIRNGGMGEKVLRILYEDGYKGRFINVSVQDQFVTHGAPDKLLSVLKMDAQSVVERVREALS